MNQILTITIGLAVVLGVGAFVWKQNQEAAPPTHNTQTTQQPEPQLPEPQQPMGSETPASQAVPPAPQASTYTAADVARHNSEASCWSIINGAVYDLTSWIPKHPGGPRAILKLCGVDGSEAFNNQHGGQSMQLKVLTGFKIGVLQ